MRRGFVWLGTRLSRQLAGDPESFLVCGLICLGLWLVIVVLAIVWRNEL